MRRQDREITNFDEMEAIMHRSLVCHLAFQGDEYPYIVPLNFGYIRQGDRFTLYFHCAKEGEKLDQMRKNRRVAFEILGKHALIEGENACSYSYQYESIIGQGELFAVPDNEKRTGLEAVMRHAAGENFPAFPDAALGSVVVLRLDVRSMTAKANRGKPHG